MPRGGQLRLLIADDSDVIVERLVAMLADVDGLQVVGRAANVLEASTALRTLKPDVLILDLRMSGGSGIDVLENMRGDPDAPIVIVFTNYSHAQYRRTCLESGARFFMDKSTEFERIGPLLSGLIRSPMNPYYFEYDPANRILAVRFEKTLTDEIFKEWYAAAPCYIEPLDVRAAIMDLSLVTDFRVSAAAIHHIAALPPLLQDPIPRFVIAPADHIYGMARMFQLASGDRRAQLAVVRSEWKAYVAIGVTSPQFEKLSAR